MTAAGGRRGDLESVKALHGGTASAVARLVQPDQAGLEHLARCLVFPTHVYPFQYGFLLFACRGDCPRFRVEDFGEAETSHTHACLFGDMFTRGSTYHDGTDAKEPSEASISRVAHPCTKGSFRKLAPPAKEKKGGPR